MLTISASCLLGPSQSDLDQSHTYRITHLFTHKTSSWLSSANILGPISSIWLLSRYLWNQYISLSSSSSSSASHLIYFVTFVRRWAAPPPHDNLSSSSSTFIHYRPQQVATNKRFDVSLTDPTSCPVVEMVPHRAVSSCCWSSATLSDRCWRPGPRTETLPVDCGRGRAIRVASDRKTILSLFPQYYCLSNICKWPSIIKTQSSTQKSPILTISASAVDRWTSSLEPLLYGWNWDLCNEEDPDYVYSSRAEGR